MCALQIIYYYYYFLLSVRYEEAQEQLSHYVKEKENPEEKEGLAKDKNRKIIQENEDDSRQISNKDETDSSDTKDNTIGEFLVG